MAGAWLLAVIVSLVAGALLPGALAQSAVAPSGDEVLFALRDVSLGLDALRVRSALATEAGGSALLQLDDGTLVGVQLVSVADGWSVRDISLVAGNPDSFHSWREPWEQRVAAAETLLSVLDSGGGPASTREARELAPLAWFEDPNESQRLWGMNPVTFRMMQALRMMPAMPMSGGSATNPVPRNQ